MRRALQLISIIIFFAIAFVIVNRVISYDTNIAHPYLTEKATDLYNSQFDNKISDSDKQKMIQGAISEDTPIRWMNHFFNPDTDKGLTMFSTAKTWAMSADLQKYYSVGDQSWQTAISSYVNGDNASAFVALGHVLHLVEDMAVPAHTRLDTHAEGDPYEGWVGKNISDIYTSGITHFSDLGLYFDNLAMFSNANFFSKDTIKNNEINTKNIRSVVFNEVPMDCVMMESEGNSFCLVNVDEDFFNASNNDYFFTDKTHSDYYSILAPKAVSYGAGVIQLFFEKAEALKAKAEAEKKEKYAAFLKSLETLFAYKNYRLVSATDLLKNTQPKQAVLSVTIQSVRPAASSTVKPITKKILIPTQIILEYNQAATSDFVDSVLPDEIILPVEVFLPSETTILPAENITNTTTDEAIYEPPQTVFAGAPRILPIPWPALILDSVFSETLYTSSSIIQIFGTCAAGTQSIFSFHATDAAGVAEMVDATTTIESEIWSAEAKPIYGNNLFSFSAIGSAEFVTSSMSSAAQVIFDNAPPASTTISVIISATSTTSTLVHLEFSAVEEFALPILYDLEYSASGSEWANLLAVSSSTNYNFITTSSGEYVFRVRGIDALSNTSDWMTTATTVELAPASYEYIHLSGTQSEDEFALTAAGGPYILEHYIVPTGKILRIGPGAVIKGLDKLSRMEIFGSLFVEGTESDRVIFTSAQDRSFVDDRANTIFFGTSDEPAPWDWVGVWFYSGGIGNINYADFRYSGSDPFLCLTAVAVCGYYSKTIYMDTASVSINNSSFSYGGETFVMAEYNPMSLSISNSVFDELRIIF